MWKKCFNSVITTTLTVIQSLLLLINSMKPFIEPKKKDQSLGSSLMSQIGQKKMVLTNDFTNNLWLSINTDFIINLKTIIFKRESSMSKQYSEVRNNHRNSTSKNFYSEFRQRDSSRDRSREDSKSKYSQSSQKSSKSNRSGPVIFGGNAVIKKT